jgi:hypothetical protein
MEPIKIEAIKKIRRDLATVIVGLEPITDAELVVNDKLTAAHKQLRSIDFQSVSHVSLVQKCYSGAE